MDARGSREVVVELCARTEEAPSARAERAKRVDMFALKGKRLVEIEELR